MRERDHSDSASTYELLRSIAESQVEKELAQERAKSRKRARRKRRQSTKRRKRTKRTPFDLLLAAGIGNSRFSPNWPSEFRGLWPRGIRIARQLGRFGSNGLSTRPASPSSASTGTNCVFRTASRSAAGASLACFCAANGAPISRTASRAI